MTSKLIAIKVSHFSIFTSQNMVKNQRLGASAQLIYISDSWSESDEHFVTMAQQDLKVSTQIKV